MMLALPHIPCFCKVKGSIFEISFSDPLPTGCGVVHEWSIEKIDERAPAGAGGEFSHFCFGTVTLEPTVEDTFQIVDLSFFKTSFPGWFPIVAAKEWATPVCRHTLEELAEIEKDEVQFSHLKLPKKLRRKSAPDNSD
jgi:hypothetical protein